MVTNVELSSIGSWKFISLNKTCAKHSARNRLIIIQFILQCGSFDANIVITSKDTNRSRTRRLDLPYFVHSCESKFTVHPGSVFKMSGDFISKRPSATSQIRKVNNSQFIEMVMHSTGPIQQLCT